MVRASPALYQQRAYRSSPASENQRHMRGFAMISTPISDRPHPLLHPPSRGSHAAIRQSFCFHGKADPLVPISQSVLIAQKLKSNGVNVLFRAFDGAGHEIMLPNQHLKTLLKEMTAFLVAIDKS